MNNRERWTLTAAVLGSAIVFVDSTVVNVALPRIGRELPTTLFGVLEGQSYVYNGYLLTRAALLINVPLVAIAVWATIQHVAETRNESASGHFDWGGAGVVAIAVGGLSFGAIYGQQRDWKDPLAYVALVAGVVATIAFPFLMARSRDPLVPLDLFRSRNFSVTNVSTLLIYGALYVSFYYLALFLHGVLGYSAAAAGLAGIPGGLL